MDIVRFKGTIIALIYSIFISARLVASTCLGF